MSLSLAAGTFLLKGEVNYGIPSPATRSPESPLELTDGFRSSKNVASEQELIAQRPLKIKHKCGLNAYRSL